MTTKVEWQNSREGFTASKCGRFEIRPGPSPRSGYILKDTVAGERFDGDTQRQVKDMAQEWVDAEHSTPRQADGKVKTQKQLVMDHLNKHGKLTRATAFTELGVCELSSRIGEIEADGWLVPRAVVKVTARNQRTVKVMEYHQPMKAAR